MGRKKVTTTVYLEAEQDRLLKALSVRTGVPVAVYIRHGVDRVLGEHEDLLPSQLSLFDGAQLSLFPNDQD